MLQINHRWLCAGMISLVLLGRRPIFPQLTQLPIPLTRHDVKPLRMLKTQQRKHISIAEQLFVHFQWVFVRKIHQGLEFQGAKVFRTLPNPVQIQHDHSRVEARLTAGRRWTHEATRVGLSVRFQSVTIGWLLFKGQSEKIFVSEAGKLVVECRYVRAENRVDIYVKYTMMERQKVVQCDGEEKGSRWVVAGGVGAKVFLDGIQGMAGKFHRIFQIQ